MPAKHLITKKSAQKQLNKLPTHIHIKIFHALRVIQNNPTSGVKLHGELSEYYKFRVGDYRIIYRYDNRSSAVEVLQIEHRQGVYK